MDKLRVRLMARNNWEPMTWALVVCHSCFAAGNVKEMMVRVMTRMAKSSMRENPGDLGVLGIGVSCLGYLFINYSP